MKTISFELVKRLKDAGLLSNIDTELTLEEVFELLPAYIIQNNYKFNLHIGYECFFKNNIEYKDIFINYGDNNKGSLGGFFHGETLLKAIENILIYLLDNNLLSKQ